MPLEKMDKPPYLKRPYGGPIQRDFLGESHLINGEWVRQGFTKEDLDFFEAEGKSKRWAEAILSISKSWDEIPQSERVRRGDLILYRLDNKIPNIHGSFYPKMLTCTIMAYPVKIDSIQKGKNGISSITITETRFTSFRDPLETLRSYGGNTEKAISRMRKGGYLRDEQMIIPVADFRMFDDVNCFLSEKFNLKLPKMPQEYEAIFGGC